MQLPGLALLQLRLLLHSQCSHSSGKGKQKPWACTEAGEPQETSGLLGHGSIHCVPESAEASLEFLR